MHMQDRAGQRQRPRNQCQRESGTAPAQAGDLPPDALVLRFERLVAHIGSPRAKAMEATKMTMAMITNTSSLLTARSLRC